MADKDVKEAKGPEGGDLERAAPRLMRRFEDLEQMFEDFWRRGWMRPWRDEGRGLQRPSFPELRTPRVDVIDQEKELVVRAEVPGIKREDLDISVDEDSVTLKGQSTRESEEEKENYYRAEITRGAFSRRIPLPATVDPDHAKAKLHDGFLELTLPKVKESRRRKVSVE